MAHSAHVTYTNKKQYLISSIVAQWFNLLVSMHKILGSRPEVCNCFPLCQVKGYERIFKDIGKALEQNKSRCSLGHREPCTCPGASARAPAWSDPLLPVLLSNRVSHCVFISPPPDAAAAGSRCWRRLLRARRRSGTGSRCWLRRHRVSAAAAASVRAGRGHQ